jgi:hypothetical protein
VPNGSAPWAALQTATMASAAKIRHADVTRFLFWFIALSEERLPELYANADRVL